MMKRILMIALAAGLISLASSEQASAQFTVPGGIYYPQYPVPTYYYVPSVGGYVPSYYGNPYYGYGPTYNTYYRARPRRTTVIIQQSPPRGQRLKTNHPSHYFGNPHASHYFPR